MEEDPDGKLHRSWRRLRITGYAAMAAVLVAVGVGVSQWFLESEPSVWDPLGAYYSPQRLESRLVPFDAPEVVVSGRAWDGDQPLDRGVKCVDAPGPVALRSEYEWVSRNPRGTSIPAYKGSGVLQPGCLIGTDYRNPIPEEVLDRVRELCELGHGPSTWRLSGRDVPVDNDGNQGNPRSWQTQTFVVGCPG